MYVMVIPGGCVNLFYVQLLFDRRKATMKQEMVVFTRTYDFISWLIPQTMKFPRSQRFIVTKRLQDAILDFYELIIEANSLKKKSRLAKLIIADGRLDSVRHYLRLCQKWTWLTQGQYQHASKMVAEIGKLLGGWIKQTSSRG